MAAATGQGFMGTRDCLTRPVADAPPDSTPLGWDEWQGGGDRFRPAEWSSRHGAVEHGAAHMVARSARGLAGGVTEKKKARHMAAQFARAPHQGRSVGPAQHAPNAALLIDFDNVTMGIRSDLSKELKNLLNSDIIKGKVAVQRAYADWRRYPQYIVPLAEASVDLIFAPAYGSSKKNATDIRLAIDALELVFTRPEIGTFILLSGDSDFSSLVLKLKEYGKYVIGVGIRESASDLLVQNCDEYYSYSVLSGLRRASDDDERTVEDPWVLVTKAVRQMSEHQDVMRSDRLKQVMLELDPNFNEREIGYSKFSKFLSDAASRGCVELRKLDNGQWEVLPPADDAEASEEVEATDRRGRDETRRSRNGRGRNGSDRERRSERREQASRATEAPTREEPVAAAAVAEAAEADAAADAPKAMDVAVDGISAAYALLRRVVDEATKGGKAGAVRDSDVKRQMLQLDPDFDETTLGFSKFSRFLRQAHDAEVIDLHRVGNGVYEVTPANSRAARVEAEDRARGGDEAREARSSRKARKSAPDTTAPAEASAQDRPEAAATPNVEPKAEAAEAEAPVAQTAPTKAEPAKAKAAGTATRTVRGIGIRRGSLGRNVPAGPPPLLPGQVIPVAEVVDSLVEKGEKVAEAEPAKETAPSVEVETTTAVKAEASQDGGAKKTAEVKKDEAKPSRRSRSSSRRSRKAAAAEAPAKDTSVDESPAAETPQVVETPSERPFAEILELPQVADDVIAYLSGRYKGVGVKTAEALVKAFGADRVFEVMHTEPDRVRELLGARRGEAVLTAWQADFAARTPSEAPAAIEAGGAGSQEAPTESTPKADEAPTEARRSRTRRGGRRGGRKNKSKAVAGGEG